MKPWSQKAHFERLMFLALATAASLDMYMLQLSAGNRHANFQHAVLRNSSDLGPGFGNAYAVRMASMTVFTGNSPLTLLTQTDLTLTMYVRLLSTRTTRIVFRLKNTGMEIWLLAVDVGINERTTGEAATFRFSSGGCGFAILASNI
jgi:hypothetical protein